MVCVMDAVPGGHGPHVQICGTPSFQCARLIGIEELPPYSSRKRSMAKTQAISLGRRHRLILLGVGLFLTALAISAFLEPRLRVLHSFQSLIYVAVVVLARRNSPWGFGIGAIMAAALNCLNLFVTHLMQTGMALLLSLIRTGHIGQPVTLMVAIGGIGHFLLLIACVIDFLELRPGIRQWGQFFAGGLLAITYLALVVILTTGHGV